MDRWHDYYLMLGPAAAALIGLLFVVVTLTSGSEAERAARGTAIYMSPTVFHLGAVVLLSGAALAPDLPPVLFAGIVGLCGLIGVGYAIYVVVRMTGTKDFEAFTSDIWWYGGAIGAFYAILLTAGVLLFTIPTLGARILAGGLMGLLLVTVHNAWDLISYMAPRVHRRKH